MQQLRKILSLSAEDNIAAQDFKAIAKDFAFKDDCPELITTLCELSEPLEFDRIAFLFEVLFKHHKGYINETYPNYSAYKTTLDKCEPHRKALQDLLIKRVTENPNEYESLLLISYQEYSLTYWLRLNKQGKEVFDQLQSHVLCKKYTSADKNCEDFKTFVDVYTTNSYVNSPRLFNQMLREFVHSKPDKNHIAKIYVLLKKGAQVIQTQPQLSIFAGPNNWNGLEVLSNKLGSAGVDAVMALLLVFTLKEQVPKNVLDHYKQASTKPALIDALLELSKNSDIDDADILKCALNRYDCSLSNNGMNDIVDTSTKTLAGIRNLFSSNSNAETWARQRIEKELDEGHFNKSVFDRDY